MSAGAEPAHLGVSVGSVLPSGAVRRGWWRVTFGIHNRGTADVELHEAWLPHGQFRGESRMPLDVTLRVGETLPLEATVHVDEPPLTMVQNAFLILRVTAAAAPSRLFVRLQVPIDADGVPRPHVDYVTSQTTGPAQGYNG